MTNEFQNPKGPNSYAFRNLAFGFVSFPLSGIIRHWDFASRLTVAGAKFEAVAVKLIFPDAEARRIAKQRPCHACRSAA